MDVVSCSGIILDSLFCHPAVAADGPGDRFIMGESQAGQQVTSNT